MKIVDEKGKVLGLINIIDLLILVMVLLVAAGAFYKFSGKSVQAKQVTVEFQVLIPHVRPELVGAVKAGDKMVKGDSYTNVTVKNVEVKPGFSINVDSRGQRVASYDPYLKDIYVTNTGATELTSATISAGGQEIREGKEYYVKSREYEFKGVIVKVDVKE